MGLGNNNDETKLCSNALIKKIVKNVENKS